MAITFELIFSFGTTLNEPLLKTPSSTEAQIYLLLFVPLINVKSNKIEQVPGFSYGDHPT